MTTMLRRSLLVALGALASASLGMSTAAQSHRAHAAEVVQPASSARASQAAAMQRDLWVGHAFWVRNVVVATFDKNEVSAKIAEQQVVANAQAIAAAIEPFYGAAAKASLFKLLAEHYGGVKAYLVATVSADASRQDTAMEALTSNADAIAAFLSTANPNLSKDDVVGLLLAHTSHHVGQIQDLKSGNYESEAKSWDQMKDHMYLIADALTGAMVKQFPAMF